MALIAVAADKGAPGVTTASIAMGAVWPRPVLLAECDPAGGDLAYRFPAVDGGRLDPRRGLLSLAVAARHGLQPHQVWEHSQKLYGGLDILAGVSGAEQGAGLELLWGTVGRLLSAVSEADVIADCGRLGVDGPIYDLLAQAASVVLLTRAALSDVIRLRDRVNAVFAALHKRGRTLTHVDVVVVADHKKIPSAIEEVAHALRQAGAPAHIRGGLAYEPKSAEQLSGQWGGKLDKSMFIRSARAIAADLAASADPSSRPPESHQAGSPQAIPPQPVPSLPEPSQAAYQQSLPEPSQAAYQQSLPEPSQAAYQQSLPEPSHPAYQPSRSEPSQPAYRPPLQPLQQPAYQPPQPVGQPLSPPPGMAPPPRPPRAVPGEPPAYPQHAGQRDLAAVSPQPHSAPVWPGQRGPATDPQPSVPGLQPSMPGPQPPVPGPQPSVPRSPAGRGRHAGLTEGPPPHGAPPGPLLPQRESQPLPRRVKDRPEPTLGTQQGRQRGGE